MHIWPWYLKMAPDGGHDDPLRWDLQDTNWQRCAGEKGVKIRPSKDTVKNLIVPVGEGKGVTNGERSNLAGGSGLGGLATAEEEDAIMSSSREVNESLICVDGNRIIHLRRNVQVNSHDHTQHTCMQNAIYQGANTEACFKIKRRNLRIRQLHPFVFSFLENIVYEYTIFTTTQQIKIVSVQHNFDVFTRDEPRRSHVHVNVSLFAVAADYYPFLCHTVLEVTPF